MSLRLPIAAKILLLALAYVVAGRLSLLLAIPPGFASAIFPPIGIALAAVLIWGYPLLLGVFLGSTLLNLSIGYSATGQLNLPGLWVALGIALGTSLQCFCATWLIRRWVHFPNPLIDEKSIFLLLLLGGPLTCLLSASVGASVLLMAGIIDPSIFDTGLVMAFKAYNVYFALIKSFVFAFIITAVPAFYGYNVKGGALEIGHSSTRAVVVSCVLLLLVLML